MGPGRAAVIDRLCIALAVNQPAVNCQTNSIRGQAIAYCHGPQRMLIGRSRRPIIAPYCPVAFVNYNKVYDDDDDVSSYSSPRHRKVGMREKASL